MADKRYSPQKVTRYAKGPGVSWILIASYDDATVRDQGESGLIRTPSAMLRAYSSDVNFFGNNDYQDGNGIHVVTKDEAMNYFDDPTQEGRVYDCDSDLALKRIMMEAVLTVHNYGHGSLEYVGFVSLDSTRSAEYLANPDQYTGFGAFSEPRIERWLVDFHKETVGD